MMECLSVSSESELGGDPVDLVNLAIVTVAYNPDLEILGRQLGQLPAAALKIVVDNAPQARSCAQLQHLVAGHGALFLQNNRNMGLAAALNRGVKYAQQTRPNCRLVLLLDQDTEPGEIGVAQLVAGYERAAGLAGKPCCIGPRLVDVVTGLDHGFHQIRGLRWIRCFPKPDCNTPILLDNLNGSGTLMPLRLFDELGGLEEDFFIDHVDTEWAFRVLAAGYLLYGIPDVAFRHRMGEKSHRFWLFGWRVWPDRSPQRHYYLFRNAMRLMHRNYVPRVWKAWALAKLMVTFLAHLLFDRRRSAQVQNMIRGIWDA